MAKQPFRWPNDARVAFVLGIAFEAWDRTKPTRGRGLQRGSLPANAVCKRDYSTETFREFGAKVGLRRLLEICERYEIRASMPINGLTCEYYPELVREAHRRGHEMVAHGWDQGEYLYMLTREQERENIRRTVEKIRETTGEMPTGWSSPGVRSTDHTLELNAEAGLLYNCDYHDDEMPYPIHVGGRLLIMIPHQYTINDHRIEEHGTRHDFFEKFKDEFDYRYRIGDRNPTMMNVITHAYLSGRIPLIDTFEQILRYARSHRDVWFARRGDVAAWARKYYTEA
ncbi:MAG TPA: polysaccharide deacetylase family protein [candidate division Zixibacteria bacterium]|nr:polysaccharide deacetylase family protein [candidate division Zixibacteria bacterium]